MFIKEITKDIICIDSSYFAKNFAAIYFIKQKDKIAIVDTGSNASIKNIKKALNSYDLDFKNVFYIILTHIHLDHAGGASQLMRICENAKLIVHPRGARHMIEPTKLIQSVKDVYGGDKFRDLYGEILPIDAKRVIEADDNFILDFYTRELKFIDTPGHAKHHFCIWDKLTHSMFTGDTFGISYREFDSNDKVYIFPSTTPVQFNPQALINSIEKVMQYNPKRLCLTHFGAVDVSQYLVNQLITGIYFLADIAKKYALKEDGEKIIQEKMLYYFLKGIQDIGFKDLEFIKNKLKLDIDINTQGLIFWQKHFNK